jgi:di/tricarboxylate transporter
MLVVAGLFGFSVPSPQAWAVAGMLAGTVFGTMTWRVLEPALVTRRARPDRA